MLCAQFAQFTFLSLLFMQIMVMFNIIFIGVAVGVTEFMVPDDTSANNNELSNS